MPPEAPGGAFNYRGARDPVISQNGRHLAFVSDTTASDALPGWGTGPVLGRVRDLAGLRLGPPGAGPTPGGAADLRP